jgi:hypothetical protein
MKQMNQMAVDRFRYIRLQLKREHMNNVNLVQNDKEIYKSGSRSCVKAAKRMRKCKIALHVCSVQRNFVVKTDFVIGTFVLSLQKMRELHGSQNHPLSI